MKKIHVVLCLVVSAATLAVLGCANESTTATTSRWCSYEVATSHCKEIRRADHVCFRCSGADKCPHRVGEKVKVGYRGHECEIKLGNRLSETCVDCKDGKKVVELK